MFKEILYQKCFTPAMALAVAQADAKRILLPFNNCDNIVAGVTDYAIGKLVNMAMDELKKIAHPA